MFSFYVTDKHTCLFDNDVAGNARAAEEVERGE